MTAGAMDIQTGQARWVRTVRALLVAGAATALLVSAARAARGIPGETSIAVNHVSGVWTGLAVDFAGGELYRPLISDAGYGGTRFFPLHFVLHGLLIRAGLGPLAAGHLVTGIALLALLAGAFLFFRRSDVSPGMAAAGALLLLANAPVDGALVTIRGDLLAAALNVCGLAVALRPRAALGAALLFALAILTKQTAVPGLAAAALALFFAGERRRAVKLVVSTALSVSVGLVAVQVASDGRFLQSMLACSTAGATLAKLVRAPINMFNSSIAPDGFLVLLGIAALFAVPAAALRNVPALFLLATAAVTVPLFGFPGIAENHFLELDLAVVIFVFAESSRHRLLPAFFQGALVVSVLLFCISVSLRPVERLRETAAAAIAETRSGSGPLLAENAWIPVLAGERPFLIDAFMFKTVADRQPEIREDLLRRLRQRFFRGVILDVDVLDRGEFAGWYRNTHFGPGFTEALLGNYHLVARHGDKLFVYRPDER
ncbi:MAG: hypothetical protein ACJ78U_20900 [Myxococcales bacterium]